MAFYQLAEDLRARQIQRIMAESARTFTHAQTARQYIELYEKMLQRPLVVEA
jgi:starch synthase/alpha-amylase